MFRSIVRGRSYDTRTNRRTNRRNKRRRQLRLRQLSLESLESRQLLSATPEFQVLNDAATNLAFRYSEAGAAQGSYSLVAANAAPRGAASTVGIEQSWVIDANRNVYLYSTSGAFLNQSWSAGSMPSNATPEGIATDGTNIWIVDSRSDKVYFYAGAASNTSGSQTATSSFNLVSSNANPKDMVTDGVSLWIVDDAGKTDRVFKYTTTGSYVGSWAIDAANKTPTGITLDPANIADLWISDSGTDRVYKYTAAASRSSGSQAAASSFLLATGNSNPQGLVVPGRPWAETPYAVEWIKQFGTSADDWGRGVSTDAAGNVYVSGVVNGTAISSPQFGTPYLAQFDAAGNLNWRQDAVGQTNHEGVRVATDTLGNVFQVVAVFDGSGSFLNNFDATGNLRWTAYLPAGEGIFSVATDDLGYAYMSSYEGSNVHIRKFDGATGAVLWVRVLDTGGFTNSSGISADRMGNIYVSAYTYGAALGANAGGADTVLAKFTDAGDLLWTRQFGSVGDDFGFLVSTDQFGNVYTSGRTFGSLGGPNAGNRDDFLAKHDANGNLLWIRQFGTSGEETGSSSWIDAVGNVYRALATNGALGGAHSGDYDIVVLKYDPAGNLQWAKQLGTGAVDLAYGGITGDAQGNLYVAGYTKGSMDGTNAGGEDAVLIKLTPPATAAGSGSLAISAALKAPTVSVSGAAPAPTPLDTTSIIGHRKASYNSKSHDSNAHRAVNWNAVHAHLDSANRSQSPLRAGVVDQLLSDWKPARASDQCEQTDMSHDSRDTELNQALDAAFASVM